MSARASAACMVLLVVACSYCSALALRDGQSSFGGRKLATLCFVCVKGTCCKGPPIPENSYHACIAGQCGWKCHPDAIPCNGKCYVPPLANSVGWCENGKVFKWGCKPSHTVCRAACMPYPPGAVNLKCNILTGLSWDCGKSWLQCFDKCCPTSLNGAPLCLFNAQLQGTCKVVCQAGYKACGSKCCKS
jgi:hypothetical protein